MQEMAARANVNEAQTVQFIIDAFHDRSSSIAILYSALLFPIFHLRWNMGSN